MKRSLFKISKILAILAIVTLTFALTGKVNAETTTGAVAKIGDTEYLTLQEAVNQGGEIVLEKDVTEDVKIPEDKTVVINLNGHNITNVNDNTIYNKGNLTIKGEGNLDNLTNAKATVYNEVGATCVLDSGNYDRSKDEKGNTYYTILNHGTMTINDGVIVKTATIKAERDGGYPSSLIENGWYDETQNTSGKDSKLTINGGIFTGGLNTIKNDGYGVLIINGGTFTNYIQFCILNWNSVEINGGRFTDEKSFPIYTASYNGYTMYKGELTVNDGIFTYDRESSAAIRANKSAKVIINSEKLEYKSKESNVDLLYTLAKKIENTTVTGIKDLEYTGKELTQDITVKDGNETLVNGTDYEVSYANNTNPGKATVTITGKGNYAGTITKTFIIRPNQVESVKVKSQKTNSITINWSEVNGVTGYKVYVFDYSKNEYQYAGKTKDTSFEVTKLKASTSYKFKVRAYVNVDGTQYFGKYSTYLKNSTRPNTPKANLSSKNGKVTFNVKKDSTTTGYKIYMSTSKNGKYTRIRTLDKNVTSYTKKGLKANKTYYFKIRAYRTVNGQQIYSDYTKILSIKVRK